MTKSLSQEVFDRTGFHIIGDAHTWGRDNDILAVVAVIKNELVPVAISFAAEAKQGEPDAVDALSREISEYWTREIVCDPALTAAYWRAGSTAAHDPQG